MKKFSKGFSEVVDFELVKAVQIATGMGINVIHKSHASKALTIILDEDNDDTKEMITPFCWKLGKNEFIKWTKISSQKIFTKITRIISAIVRSMSNVQYMKLIENDHFEEDFIYYLRNELSRTGINIKGFTTPALTHIWYIYGREAGVTKLIKDIFYMIETNKDIPNKCRSCIYAKLCNGKVKCRCSTQSFAIDGEMTVEQLTKAFPDVDLVSHGDFRCLTTNWVPGEMSKCDEYYRRF